MSLLLCWMACVPGDRTFPLWQDTSAPADTSGDTGQITDTDTGSGGDTGTDIPPGPVGVGFTGEVVSVTGNPLGFDDLLEETFVSGAFTYDRRIADGDPLDPDHAEYDHQTGTGPFTLFLEGRILEGSGNPIVAIDVGSDTFTFSDGPQIGEPAGVDRGCSFDEVEDRSIVVVMSLGSGTSETAFDDDRLPAVFPFLGFDVASDVDVTFTVEDDNGVLTLALDDLLD